MKRIITAHSVRCDAQQMNNNQLGVLLHISWCVRVRLLAQLLESVGAPAHTPTNYKRNGIKEKHDVGLMVTKNRSSVAFVWVFFSELYEIAQDLCLPANKISFLNRIEANYVLQKMDCIDFTELFFQPFYFIGIDSR